jgi:hypothetical protein
MFVDEIRNINLPSEAYATASASARLVPKDLAGADLVRGEDES